MKSFIFWFIWIVFWSFAMSYLVPIIRCKIGNHFFPVSPSKQWNGRKYVYIYKCYRCGEITTKEYEVEK